MFMVKLPNLELKEVEQILEALDNYCATLGAQGEVASEYARLAEMLKRRAGVKYPTPSRNPLETQVSQSLT